MKTRVLLTVSLITLFTSTVFAQQKVGWVTAYWAGWAKTSPKDVAWKSYTHLCIFSATPDGRGGCKLAMGWNDARVKAAVAEGHRNHVKALLCVGGGGVGRNFVRCTADADARAVFIKNIIGLMKEYEFDGVDMDWEELQGKNAEYVALHKELRAELDKITPRPLLTAAIANWMFNRTTAEIHPYMDQLNNMSYWTRAVKNGTVDVADIAKDMQGLVDKGVPKAKLGVGIGLDYEEHRPEVDCDPQACTAKCRFAIDQGYGGVMIWAIDKDAKKSGGKQPCHEAIFPFKPTDDGTKGNQKTSVEAEVGTEANRMVEIAFTASRDYGNPFHDVTLDILFDTPHGNTLKVPAFWAGGRIWKVRYSSSAPGNHRWRSVCSAAADGGLNGITGTVIVEPYHGENPLYLHGPLRVAADHRHFEHVDGTPFFWLADTWWMGLCQRLHWPQEFQQLAADRKAKGFSVIQIVAGLYPDMPAFDPRGANEAGFPWEKDYSRIRPEYFDKADRRIFYLVDQGFVPCIVGAWGFHLPWLGEDRIKEHWRYLIARYGALPVVWCAAGEGTMPFYGSPHAAEDAAIQKKGWTEVIRSMRATDPYNRMITLHPTQAARENVTDPTVLDFDMHQTGHAAESEIGKMARQMRAAYDAPPKMPVIAGESSYDGLDFKDWGGGVLSSDASRQMFWTGLMQNGAAGGTYGANGVWQVNRRDMPYGPSPHGRSWGSIPWDEAMQRPGSTQVGFAKKFFARYPWSRLEPRPAAAGWAGSQRAANNIQPWAVGAADELLIVYVPRPLPIMVRQLPPHADYTADLFDPVAGQSTSLAKIEADGHGDWNCPPPDYKHDWVVVLEKQGKADSLPAQTFIKKDPFMPDPARLKIVEQILRQVPLIDGHNDLPWRFREECNDDPSGIDLARDYRGQLPTVLADSPLFTDIPRLRAGHVGGQFWSVYVPAMPVKSDAVVAVLEQIDMVHRMIARYPNNFELALTADDVVRIHRQGKIASLIGMEGGHSIGNSLGVLRRTYALGARYMTLTHMQNNDWADSATDTAVHHGLTPFGEQVVREMNRLGMLVDLSHVSDETMLAALRITQAPVIFSHSGARALCHHLRNVPDDILQLVAKNKGVVMVSFVPEYLTEIDRADEIELSKEKKRLKALYPKDKDKVKEGMAAWRALHPDPRHSTLLDAADHIDHIRKVAGIDSVGIGSDFEGFDNPPRGLDDVACYPALLAELLKRGYSEDDIKKVAGLNLLRVLREAEKASAQLSSHEGGQKSGHRF